MRDRHLSRRTVLTATATVAAAVSVGAAPLAHADGKGGGHSAGRDQRLKRLISRMSLEEKVGQLFVSYVYGKSATAPEQAHVDLNLRDFGVRNATELINRYHLGGILYFNWSHNIGDPYQLAEMSNDIQRAGLAQPTPVPLLLSIDQEHGVVNRIGKPATLLPGAMALGAGGSRSDARNAAYIAGSELAAMGILQNFAPVADVNVNPANPIIGVRSFGSDGPAAARLVAAQVLGYQGAGVAASSKHFPGHGDTTVDSHTGLPLITHTREEWDRIDAPPFRSAIKAGIDSIMTAHIQFPALDPSNDPATLSRPIITGILREELGFKGVIVTDALNMKGVREKYGDDRVPVLALKAGVDQLLFPFNLDIAWKAVVAAVRSGELTVARIEESVLRILRLKDKVGLLKDPFVSRRDVDRTVGIRKHLVAADGIAERTTTLLVNKRDALPLRRRRQRKVLVVGADPASPTGTDRPATTILATSLTELGFTTTTLPTGTAPNAAKIDEAVAAASGQDAVLVATHNVSATSAQRTLVARLVATGVPVINLAIRNPYDIAQLDGGVVGSVASYGWTEVELRAAARVIGGRVEPEGRLPVPVLRADDPTKVLLPVGHGLSYDD
ncbi:glycoside hydrolase family 3 protein [Streptomyces sp. NPDC020965]|uniref:glycoside hydrolase family 3 protein n=1 Tax=Streptomyces sp. NPDC020965 TaxID=3365105 RepID=UPI0037B68C66